MMARRRGVFAIGLLLAVQLSGSRTLRGQQPAPDQPPPLFRSGANLVAVDAVVHDKKGQFVLDLKPEDFELREDGKPVAIDQFYLVRGRSTAPSARDATPAPAEPFAPPPAATPPRVFILIFDTDHLTVGGFKRAQAAGATLFAQEFQPGDIGGVVANGQMANKRLTSSREELEAAVRDAKPSTRTA